MQGLTLEISFADQEMLLTPQISSVPEKQLKSPIGPLSHFVDVVGHEQQPKLGAQRKI